MNLSLVRIQRFVAVAEHLSFTRAATLLGIDQPWLSRQIMQLEDQLGIMLFERSGTRITLTREGREFYEVAREVEIAAQRVQEKAMEMTRRNKAALTACVAYATFSLEGRNRLLRKFAAIRPDVTVDITAAEWTDDVVEQVKASEADFGIAFGPLDDPNLETCELEPLRLMFAVPKENPLAAKSSIALSDLAGQPVAFTVKDARTMGLTHRYEWLFGAGIQPVHVPEGRRYIFDVAQAKRLCVVCFTPADKVPDDFVKLPFKDALPEFNVVLVRAKRIMSPSAERLWRLAHEMGGEDSEKKNTVTA